MTTTMTTTDVTTTAVRTARFGDHETVTVTEDAIWSFPEGMPGFELHTRFALLEHERLSPFMWLQSLADPNVGFLVIEPAMLVNDYSFDLNDSDAERIGLTDEIQPRVLAVLVVPGDVRDMTANLQAPLVLNPAGHLGKQVILTDERYPLRHQVFGGQELRTRGARHPGAKHAARRRAC